MPGAGHPGVWPDFRDLMSRTLCENALQEPDVRAIGRISGLARCPGVGPDVRAPNPRMNSRNSILGRKLMISRAKLERFRGWKVGKNGGKARSTRNQANPWIKSNKTSSNEQITKNRGYFGWGFLKLGKNTTKLG